MTLPPPTGAPPWRRTCPPGVLRGSERIVFRFEGRPIEAAPGESLAAALLAAGETGFRMTRGGSSRGPFCGMGACFDCLVTVEGATQRACLQPARPDLDVRRHHPQATRPPSVEPKARRQPLCVDVAVVGAGPAGLAAALVAARAELSTLLVDERKQPGGQYFKQPALGFDLDEGLLDRQTRAGRALIAEVRAAGVTILSETSVWAPLDEGGLALVGPDGARTLFAQRLVIAAGATERAHPFPGWTLPGVLTTGAAQTFLRAHGIGPGGRIVVAGNGPLNLQLAAELLRAGLDVAALIEAAPRPGLAAARDLAAMAVAAPGLVADGLAYRALAMSRGVRVHHGAAILAAKGGERVEEVSVTPLGPDGRPEAARAERIACDVLCLGYGFSPAVELPRALGCQLTYDPRFGHLKVERDHEGRSSRPDVYVVGDGAEFGGARIAVAQGRLVGAAIARDLGAPLARGDATRLRRWQGDLDRARSFQTALWRVFAARLPVDALATPDTLVCRCEEVTLAQLDATLDEGMRGLGAVKRETRLGMGRCNGRYCAPFAAERMASNAGRFPAPDDGFAPRPPVRPVTVADLAGFDTSSPACGLGQTERSD